LAPLDDALTETPARPDRACASDQLQAHRIPPRRLMRPSTRAHRVGALPIGSAVCSQPRPVWP